MYDFRSSWEEYKKLIKDRPEEFNNTGDYFIVKNDREVEDYYTKTNKKVGVIYKSEYSILVVDLIKSDKDELYTYERILPTVRTGAVVIMTLYKGNFILLDQYRHAMRCYQYSFPRGFGESDIGDYENARRELRQELSAEILDLYKLGTVVADSGLNGNQVSIFVCSIGNYSLDAGHEGIRSILEVSFDDFQQMIADGCINDSFTLSSFTMFRSIIETGNSISIPLKKLLQ